MNEYVESGFLLIRILPFNILCIFEIALFFKQTVFACLTIISSVFLTSISWLFFFRGDIFSVFSTKNLNNNYLGGQIVIIRDYENGIFS